MFVLDSCSQSPAAPEPGEGGDRVLASSPVKRNVDSHSPEMLHPIPIGQCSLSAGCPATAYSTLTCLGWVAAATDGGTSKAQRSGDRPVIQWRQGSLASATS